MPLRLDLLPPRNHEETAEDPDAMDWGARELRLASCCWVAELRLVAVCVGVPMVGRGSSFGLAAAVRRAVLRVGDDDDLLLAAAAGFLELPLAADRANLEVAGMVGVTAGRPGWLRIR